MTTNSMFVPFFKFNLSIYIFLHVITIKVCFHFTNLQTTHSLQDPSILFANLPINCKRHKVQHVSNIICLTCTLFIKNINKLCSITFPNLLICNYYRIINMLSNIVSNFLNQIRPDPLVFIYKEDRSKV